MNSRLFLAPLFFPLFLAQVTRADTYQHVIHISVDGLGGTYLNTALNGTVPAGAPTAYPNFLRLRTQGAYTFNARTDYTTTFTLPDHTSMFTGLAVQQPAGQPSTSFHNVTVVTSTGVDTLRSSSTGGRYLPGSFDVAHDKLGHRSPPIGSDDIVISIYR